MVKADTFNFNHQLTTKQEIKMKESASSSIIKNKKGQGGTLMTLVAATLVIMLILTVFYIISFGYLEKAWNKVMGKSNVDYVKFGLSEQGSGLLENYLNQSVNIAVNGNMQKISMADLIRLWHKERKSEQYNILKESTVNYFNKLEYFYSDRVRGYNLWMQETSFEAPNQHNAVGGADFKSKNYESGDCIRGVVGMTEKGDEIVSCLFFGKITISAIDGKMIYIALGESDANKLTTRGERTLA